jgi:hypothetical protein
MNVLNWDELEDGKAYLKHDIDEGHTSMCRARHTCGGRYQYILDEGDVVPKFAIKYKDCVFVEVEMPSRSDWALAILQKDSQ